MIQTTQIIVWWVGAVLVLGLLAAATFALALVLNPAAKAEPVGQIKRSDVLLDDALELVKVEQAVSVRLIKTRLDVGTTRAMKIIDELQRDGVVSGVDGNGARKVLVQT